MHILKQSELDGMPSDEEIDAIMRAIEAYPESRDELRQRVVNATVNDIAVTCLEKGRYDYRN